MVHINDLPAEVLINIFFYFPIHKLAQYAIVCRKWSESLGEENVSSEIISLVSGGGKVNYACSLFLEIIDSMNKLTKRKFEIKKTKEPIWKYEPDSWKNIQIMKQKYEIMKAWYNTSLQYFEQPRRWTKRSKIVGALKGHQKIFVCPRKLTYHSDDSHDETKYKFSNKIYLNNLGRLNCFEVNTSYLISDFKGYNGVHSEIISCSFGHYTDNTENNMTRCMTMHLGGFITVGLPFYSTKVKHFDSKTCGDLYSEWENTKNLLQEGLGIEIDY